MTVSITVENYLLFRNRIRHNTSVGPSILSSDANYVEVSTLRDEQPAIFTIHYLFIRGAVNSSNLPYKLCFGEAFHCACRKSHRRVNLSGDGVIERFAGVKV